jgi:hypothetical protein
MKKLLLAMTFAALTTTINAQEQPKQFNLTVTPEELQVIGAALEELPFKKSAPLMNKLNTQVQSQMATTPKTDPTQVPIPTPKPN